MSWRAFDKTVRREPLAFAVDAVYGNSIDLELEVIAKKEVARKALLLIFVDVGRFGSFYLRLRPNCCEVRRGNYWHRGIHKSVDQSLWPNLRLADDLGGTVGRSGPLSHRLGTFREIFARVPGEEMF